MSEGKSHVGRRKPLNVCFIITIALSAALAHAAQPVPDPLKQIPNGYMDGRIDAKYGTYNTPMGIGARPFQNRLLQLEQKAYGLAKLVDEDPVGQAELIYLLETEILRLHLDIGAAPAASMSEFERRSLLYGTVRAYEDVRHHSERLYENMIRFIDVKLPGPNGQQIRKEIPRSVEPTYTPNYRSDKDLTPKQRAELYREKSAEFVAKGGSLDELHILSTEFYKTLPGYSRFEYVVLPSGQIWVTSGNAGHILLARGGEVKCAGQVVFLKNPKGETTMIIVSNASGSYKPDILNARKLADHLAAQMNVPEELVVITKGEPVSTQAVKIYMKGNGADTSEIKNKIRGLEDVNRNALSKPAGFVRCGAAFS